jgi:hypothetical protein
LTGCQSDATLSYNTSSSVTVLTGDTAKRSVERFDYLLNAIRTEPAALAATPAIARASNGDVIMLWGQAELGIGTKMVNGSGTYTHTDAAGNIIVQGTWLAEQLVSFRSFGGQDDCPASWVGRKASIRLWMSGNWENAMLTLFCTVGDCSKRSVEGATLSVKRGLKFNEPVSGQPLFLQD